MSEGPASNQPGSDDVSAAPTEPEERPIRSAVIATVIGLLILGGVGFAFSYLWDKPTMVPVTGRIMVNGEPLATGFVMAKRVRDQTMSISGLDKEGRFVLSTNGTDGAWTGTHKLVVRAMTNEMPPSSLIPGKYTDESTTPLSIDVRIGSENHFEFDIEK
jgi:hypothetical protein